MNGEKFETWLGSIVGPDERFYLIAADEEVREEVIRKAAKIGYEANIAGAMLSPAELPIQEPSLDLTHFKAHPEDYHIVDIRNTGEFESGAFFPQAVNIPLSDLRERVSEVQTDKPVVVHCAGGYRSAAGSSIVQQAVGDTPVYDLSEAVEEFQTASAN